MNLREQIQTIPNDAEVCITVVHQKAEGKGFVVTARWVIPIKTKDLKRLANVCELEPTAWERFKLWLTNFTTKSR